MQEETPKPHYLFVCTGSRCHELAETNEEGASVLQKQVKAEIKAKGYHDNIRVSKSGCLGMCETAPNIMYQPENRMCSHVQLCDKDEIVKTLEQYRSNDFS